MSIMRHPYIWILIVGFEECDERIIQVNSGFNQMVGFGERCDQILFKVGQSQLNLIVGLEIARICEIQIRIWIIGIERYGDILVLEKFENSWIVRLMEHC